MIVPKHQREFKSFDDNILSMYARGMTTREIAGHLKEIYGTDVSPELISRATDSVKGLLEDWRNRTFYPILFLDALVINVRENGKVVKKSIYMALAINQEGRKEPLGLWIDQAEGAKFWLKILNELHNQGLQECWLPPSTASQDFQTPLPRCSRRLKCNCVLSTWSTIP